MGEGCPSGGVADEVRTAWPIGMTPHSGVDVAGRPTRVDAGLWGIPSFSHDAPRGVCDVRIMSSQLHKDRDTTVH